MKTFAEQVRSASKITIGIAELHVSATPGETLITYALGSCLGICVYDPQAQVAGLLHAMLPSARASLERSKTNPERFVDSGVPQLFKAAYALGARKERMILAVAGGAAMTPSGNTDSFQIGRRNFIALKKILWRNGVILRDCDVGGGISRTISMDVTTGEVRVKSGSEEYRLTRQFPREPETRS